MRLRIGTARTPAPTVRQRLLPFLERSERLATRFRAAIVALTALAVVAMFGGTVTGRYAVETAARHAKWTTMHWVAGLEPRREEIDAQWAARRHHGMVATQNLFRRSIADAGPELLHLLALCGMTPDDAVIRWGNFNRTLVLSSKVFEPDDLRSYRLKPDTQAIWLQRLTLKDGLSGLLLMPDTPEVREAGERAGAIVDPSTVQTTNSWGCRGPEPDLSAPVRGLVLGDSFMQGLFVGDDETPPECLRRSLEERLDQPVSILNTGHLGYSIDQYYHTLLEYEPKFQPQFLVVAICSNDFGDGALALKGEGDWEEGRFWLNEIQQYCRTRGILCLVTPIPNEIQMTGRRTEAHFPGRVSNMSEGSGLSYLYPMEAFANEHLRLVARSERETGHRPQHSLLFNGHIGDGHFSALGSQLWGDELAERIALLMKTSAGLRPFEPLASRLASDRTESANPVETR